jgi:hypothetical protein
VEKCSIRIVDPSKYIAMGWTVKERGSIPEETVAPVSEQRTESGHVSADIPGSVFSSQTSQSSRTSLSQDPEEQSVITPPRAHYWTVIELAQHGLGREQKRNRNGGAIQPEDFDDHDDIENLNYNGETPMNAQNSGGLRFWTIVVTSFIFVTIAVSFWLFG